MLSMTHRIRKILLSSTVLLAAIAGPVFSGTAHAADDVCVTTSVLKKSRPWPGSRQIKLTFCSDGYNVRSSLHAKGVTSNMTVFTSIKAEFRLRDSKGKTVFSSTYDLGDRNRDFSSMFGITYWEKEDTVGFTLDQPSKGMHRLEGRLIVDWEGDGKGPQKTGFKRLVLER